MISAENGRLAAALAGTGLMVDGRSGPGLTWLIIFDFLIIKKTKPLSHLSQCGSGFVALAIGTFTVHFGGDGSANLVFKLLKSLIVLYLSRLLKNRQKIVKNLLQKNLGYCT